MLIKEWMSKAALTINQDASLSDAINLFQTRIISLLPVLDDGRLVGVVTDGDIKKSAPSNATTLERFEMASLMDRIKIKSIMSTPAVTIESDRTIDEAADLMLTRCISGMPVLGPSGNIEGVITKSDIFRCLVSFTGVANRGQVFAFRLQDKPGAIKAITDSIRETGGKLCSILTSHDDVEEGFRKVFFHTFNLDAKGFDQLVLRFRGTGDLYYCADLSRRYRTAC